MEAFRSIVKKGGIDMSRKFEKTAAYTGSAWQIASGLYTVFIYSMKVRGMEAGIAVNSHIQETSAKLMADNLYMISVTFGMFSLIVGALNIYLSRKLNDKKAEIGIPIWFVICGFVSYLITDFISAIAFIAAGVIAIARNKTIKTYFET
jgi:uncharacterized membrane protein YvlD (DUF360 family)